MLVQTPECIVCFMLMNVKVLVVHCGFYYCYCHYWYIKYFLIKKEFLHEVVGVDGFGGVEVVFVFEGKQTLIFFLKKV